MNLLESAGFSRSNPYYVVQQGKVIVDLLLSCSNVFILWFEHARNFISYSGLIFLSATDVL